MNYYIPYTDMQSLPPAGWCPECGMEIYAEGKGLCTRCEARRKAQEEEDV